MSGAELYSIVSNATMAAIREQVSERWNERESDGLVKSAMQWIVDNSLHSSLLSKCGHVLVTYLTICPAIQIRNTVGKYLVKCD